MASPPAPPSTPYRPWEDTSPAAPPTSFHNGRPSLALPPPLVTTERMPPISSSALSPHNPRKRRRFSKEGMDRPHHGPGLSSLGSPSEVHSTDFRSSEGGGGGNMYWRGDAVGDKVLSSACIKPNHNHFTQPPPPPPLHKPPPLQQAPSSSSISPRFPGSRPATPPQQHNRNHQSPANQSPTALTNIVSSIHNLTIDLATSSSVLSSSNTPSPIAPHQLPSIEALATCLETIYSLLKRLKPSLAQQQQQQQPQTNGNPVSNEQQAFYTSNLSNLQRSLSTLQIAHRTLENEHNSLLSAFTRTQTRTSALDRKLLVCTEETESLANERERLMGVVEGLEETLTEVRAERDEVRLEMRKSGAQWGTIVQNAGKLEKGACKVEKALRKEIEGLKNDVERLRTAVADGGRGCCAAVGEAGERERIDLKNRVRELESRLEEMKTEGKKIYELAELISKTGKGIAESR